MTRSRVITKPSAVRKTVVDFCKKNKMSVRQFEVAAKKSKLRETRDIEKMERNLIIWNKLELV